MVEKFASKVATKVAVEKFAISLPPPSNSTPRWGLGRADWNEFSTSCNELIIDAECLEANDPMEHFTNLVIHIADKSIPKTPTSPRKGKLWLDDDCRKAIRKRKQALRKVEFHPSPENLSLFRQVRAKTRKTIRNYKKSSWREYVSKLKSKTPMNKIWKMVRKISGKTSPQPIHLFSKNNSSQTSSVEETANIMGETFQRNSSSISHSDKFKKFKIHAEKKPLHFSSDNSETYNLPFSMQELISSLDRAHDTSPGPDKVHYQMFETLAHNCAIHSTEHIQ